MLDTPCFSFTLSLYLLFSLSLSISPWHVPGSGPDRIPGFGWWHNIRQHTCSVWCRMSCHSSHWTDHRVPLGWADIAHIEVSNLSVWYVILENAGTNVSQDWYNRCGYECPRQSLRFYFLYSNLSRLSYISSKKRAVAFRLCEFNISLQSSSLSVGSSTSSR